MKNLNQPKRIPKIFYLTPENVDFIRLIAYFENVSFSEVVNEAINLARKTKEHEELPQKGGRS